MTPMEIKDLVRSTELHDAIVTFDELTLGDWYDEQSNELTAEQLNEVQDCVDYFGLNWDEHTVNDLLVALEEQIKDW
jgi:hypothetical protein